MKKCKKYLTTNFMYCNLNHKHVIPTLYSVQLNMEVEEYENMSWFSLLKLNQSPKSTSTAYNAMHRTEIGWITRAIKF